MIDINPLPTDTLFPSSPPFGHPCCVCSRCQCWLLATRPGERFQVTDEQTGVVIFPYGEYRYCYDCLELMGLMPLGDQLVQFDFELEERTCRVCGCTDNSACLTNEGPCHWVTEDLCSACV